MADRVEWFDVLVPAQTLLPTTFTQHLRFLQGWVRKIDAKILDGPVGLMGFYIASGGSRLIPRTNATFIRPNNDYFQWPIRNAINSGDFAITAYNSDIWDHSIQVGFEIDELGATDVSAPSVAGASSTAALAAVPALTDSSTAAFDPLSPDSILAATSPEVTDLLVSQLPEVPVTGVLSDAGIS